MRAYIFEKQHTTAKKQNWQPRLAHWHDALQHVLSLKKKKEEQF
jgi:hypothetical protein